MSTAAKVGASLASRLKDKPSLSLKEVGRLAMTSSRLVRSLTSWPLQFMLRQRVLRMYRDALKIARRKS
jgi:hypothetical protein